MRANIPLMLAQTRFRASLCLQKIVIFEPGHHHYQPLQQKGEEIIEVSNSIFLLPKAREEP